jgi:hypothetical protein
MPELSVSRLGCLVALTLSREKMMHSSVRLLVISCTLALAGCLSQVDREAISFPAMPGQARYQRADGQLLAGDAAIDALQTAESVCRGQSAGPVVGTPAFDQCMQAQGYRRVQ